METVMSARTLTLAGAMAVIAIASVATPHSTRANDKPALALGNFSVSLAVKDIAASKAFYDKLDFKQVGGKLEQKWVVMQNGAATIGLFQGMFNKNIMTFNPGWNAAKEPLKEFHDVRELQRALKARGLALVLEADEASVGPAHFMLADPDGNTLLFDQHVPRPAR
jgi:catechol 2,3-dioxygenase-like lactoylglutathione lyase family enzyme